MVAQRLSYIEMRQRQNLPDKVPIPDIPQTEQLPSKSEARKMIASEIVGSGHSLVKNHAPSGAGWFLCRNCRKKRKITTGMKPWLASCTGAPLIAAPQPSSEEHALPLPAASSNMPPVRLTTLGDPDAELDEDEPDSGAPVLPPPPQRDKPANIGARHAGQRTGNATRCSSSSQLPVSSARAYWRRWVDQQPTGHEATMPHRQD